MNDARKLFKYLTAGWCVIFGAVHVLWLLGFYLGLPQQQAVQAFNRTWFWCYNVFAAAACFLGGFITVKLSSGGLNLKSYRFLQRACLAFTALLLLRAIGGLVQFIRVAIKNAIVLNWSLFWDAWFLTGSILFALYVYHSRKRTSSSRLFDNY